MSKEEKMYWVEVRGEEIRNVFENRKKAIKYFKTLLKQTLKDFDKQDKSDEYDYPIKIPEIKIIPFKKREAYLSLL